MALLQTIELDAGQTYLSGPGHEFAAALGVRTHAGHAVALEHGASLVAAGPDDQPVGFALVVPLDGAAHLLELASARQHQRQGVSRLLLSAVECWASAARYGEVTLTTYREVPWNAPAYERLGYRTFGPPPWRQDCWISLRDEPLNGVARAPRLASRKVLTGTSGPRELQAS